MLDDIHEEPTVFEREFVLDEMDFADEPYTVEYDEKDNMYVVEGPRIERMLGYTNLDSEKGFQFSRSSLRPVVFWRNWNVLALKREIPYVCMICSLIITSNH